MHTTMSQLGRALMTIGCRDCDPIPKTELAGKLIEFDGEIIQVMHNGLKVKAGGYYGEWMSHIIRGLQGHHEPQEELVFYYLMRYVRNSSLMIELGCFWSYYSLWFLSEIPSSLAIGIEPDIKHLEIGRRNAKLNGLSSRISFINAWVGGKNLDTYSSATENSSKPVSLPMLNGSSLLPLIKGRTIELLHMDTQGAEFNFINSIESIVADKLLRFLMVSTHHSSISGSPNTHFECLQKIKEFGGIILVEHDVIESFSGDGLILASFYPEDKNLYFPDISRNKAETSMFTKY